MKMHHERHEKRESGQADHFRDVTKMVGKPEPKYREFAIFENRFCWNLAGGVK